VRQAGNAANTSSSRDAREALPTGKKIGGDIVGFLEAQADSPRPVLLYESQTWLPPPFAALYSLRSPLSVSFLEFGKCHAANSHEAYNYSSCEISAYHLSRETTLGP